MKPFNKLLIVLCLVGDSLTIQAQNTIPASGGNATGADGTVSYSIGQVTYNTFSGTNGTGAQGVQQPYEISIVTAIENSDRITLEYKIYPNPTTGLLKLIISPFDHENFRYKLYDINGILFQDKKIESEEIEISMVSLLPSIYFLKIIKDNQEAKVFRIIKR
jgi:hypothetical protein